MGIAGEMRSGNAHDGVMLQKYHFEVVYPRVATVRRNCSGWQQNRRQVPHNTYRLVPVSIVEVEGRVHGESHNPRGITYAAVAAKRSRFFGLATIWVAAGKMRKKIRSVTVLPLESTRSELSMSRGMPINIAVKRDATARARNVSLAMLVSCV